MPRVERRTTPISLEDAATMMRKHMRPLHDVDPSAGPLLLAQVWMETGHAKSMIQHNWGNITGAYQGDYWEPPWVNVGPDSSERNRKLHQLMLEGKAPSKFRAYPDHETGLHDYLTFLSKPRFLPIIEAAEKGDAETMAERIQDTGYCPDCPVGPTAATLRQLSAQFKPLFPADVEVPFDLPRPKIGVASVVYAVAGVGLAAVIGYMGWQYVVEKAREVVSER